MKTKKTTLSETKLKGDIAETRVTYELLRRGLFPSKPVGDRMPYDLIIDNGKSLLKIQIKSNFSETTKSVAFRKNNWCQRVITYRSYSTDDFDFAIVWDAVTDFFYIYPVSIVADGKAVTLDRGQRKYKYDKTITNDFRDRWDFLQPQKE
jgi:hypothetical protein